MTEITNKQKEAISQIYLMTVVSTDLRYKLTFLTQLYAAIRSALLAADIIEPKMITQEIKDSKGSIISIIQKDSGKIQSTAKDQFDSARKLQEAKNKLYDAYTAFAYRDNWINAEQTTIEIIERLSALGYLHDFFDVDPERWSASYSMISPNGAFGGDDAD